MQAVPLGLYFSLSVRVPDVCQCRRKRPLIVFKMDAQLFEQAAYSGILKENEFRVSDHDLLMPITNVICIVGPFLRSLRPNDVDSLRRLLNLDDCSFGSQ